MKDRIDELTELVNELAASNKELDDKVEKLKAENKKLWRENFNILRQAAKALGFKPYGKGQVIWAKSKQQADSIKVGESVFKFVEEALNES